MKKYVLGFAINHDAVLLVRKNKPAWQKGKLNGIGGGIEDFDKFPVHAMVREFKEETGLDSKLKDWKNFCIMYGSDFEIHCFRNDNIKKFLYNHNVKNDIGELLYVGYISDFWQYDEDELISNVPWLIKMSEDCDTDRRPLEIIYK
jgi:8-oxo-dGTP diphosphatase